MIRRAVRSALVVGVLVCFGGAAMAATATTQPSSGGGALEIAANEAFGAGRYAVALPMLQQLAEKMKDQPDQLGSIQEKIRVCQSQMTAMANVQAPQTGPDIPMTAETRHPHLKPKPGEIEEMSIKELGNFEYDAEHGGNIPRDVLALSGSKVKLHGFMIPMDQAEHITKFALVPSLFACCYGQPPQIQHTVMVQCPEGKSVSYYPDEINVVGTLKVDEKKEDGFIVSVFDLDVTSVKPAAK